MYVCICYKPVSRTEHDQPSQKLLEIKRCAHIVSYTFCCILRLSGEWLSDTGVMKSTKVQTLGELRMGTAN